MIKRAPARRAIAGSAPQALGAPRLGLVRRAPALLAVRASTNLQLVRPTKRCAFGAPRAPTAPCRVLPLARHAPVAHGVGISRPPRATSAQKVRGRTQPVRCTAGIARRAWAWDASGTPARAS